MLQLAQEEEKRAERLHKKSLVVDSLRYFIGPLSKLPPHIEQQIDQKLESELGKKEIDLNVMLGELIVDDDAFREAYLQQWSEAGVDVINQTIGAVGNRPSVVDAALQSLATWTMLFDELNTLKKVTCVQDAYDAKASGQYGVILGFQDTTFLQGDIAGLDRFYQFGLRIVQLTYNMMNDMGAGCTERVDGGLSHKGVALVKRLNELGILIDASHCGPKTTLDIIENSERPIAFTHATCRAVYLHDRGKTDEAIRALAEKGGYMGIAIVPAFLSDKKKASVDDFLNHLDHAVDLAGPEHVGIGTDWGAVYPRKLSHQMNLESSQTGFRLEHRLDYGATIDGFERWADWPNFTRGLVARGYSDKHIEWILGKSFLNSFEKAVG